MTRVLHLILDLDETLVNINTKRPKKYDFVFTIQNVSYYGKKRPFLDKFLKFVFQKFKTVNIWTAATRDYAINVLLNIMTQQQLDKLTLVYSRENLYINNGSYVKALDIIFSDPKAVKKGIKHNNTIMVDDREEVLAYNPGNSIIIPPWGGKSSDKYLSKLIIILCGILDNREIELGLYDRPFYLSELTQ